MTSLKQSHESLQHSYEDLLRDLQERNEKGLIFHPFEKIHEKILNQGKFYDGVFAVNDCSSNDCSGRHLTGDSTGLLPFMLFLFIGTPLILLVLTMHYQSFGLVPIF